MKLTAILVLSATSLLAASAGADAQLITRNYIGSPTIGIPSRATAAKPLAQPAQNFYIGPTVVQPRVYVPPAGAGGGNSYNGLGGYPTPGVNEPISAPYIPLGTNYPLASYPTSGYDSNISSDYGRQFYNTSTYFFGGGYDFPYYCPNGFNSVIYPSAYGDYEGVPSDFYAPEYGVIVTPGPVSVINPYSGQYYQLNSDPFYNSSGFYSANQNSDEGENFPAAWSAAFAPIAQSWAGANPSGIAGYLPGDGSGVAVGFNGAYDYSLAPNAYELMTSDAMKRIATTDFRFTDARIRPDGSATAWAVQKYRAASGASGTVYLSYTLQRDPAVSSGYRLEAVDSSRAPLTSRQRLMAMPAANTR